MPTSFKRPLALSLYYTVGSLLSGHPRDFQNWPLNRGWPFERGRYKLSRNGGQRDFIDYKAKCLLKSVHTPNCNNVVIEKKKAKRN